MKPRGLVLHLTDSTFGDAAEIDKWHKANGWKGIGYHRVVLNGVRKSGSGYVAALDGVVEPGRADDVQGAHCKAAGMNVCTLGLTCVGKPGKVPAGAEPAPETVTTAPYLTRRQWETLVDLAARLCVRHKLDPLGTFVHPTTGRTMQVITQHSQHESGKPHCASLRMPAVRSAIAARVATIAGGPAAALAPASAMTPGALAAAFAAGDAAAVVEAMDDGATFLVPGAPLGAEPDADPPGDVADADVDAVAAMELAPLAAAADVAPAAVDAWAAVADDALSPDDVARLKYALWSTPTLASFADAPAATRVVAEGDSWFDYLPGLDLLDQLKRHHGYEIFKVARAGDTLDNMVYGTEIDENFARRTPPIRATLEAVRQYQPAVLLFSGGGNDIAGPELEAYLNHRDSRLPVLRETQVEGVIGGAMRQAYVDLIRVVREARPGIQIVAHGYGIPVPDGRAVRLLGVRFAGPWLRPALARKGVVDAAEARDVMRRLLTRFNDMLAEVAATHDDFHYVDLRDLIGDDDWANELHPRNGAFRRAADRIAERVRAVTAASRRPVA